MEINEQNKDGQNDLNLDNLSPEDLKAEYLKIAKERDEFKQAKDQSYQEWQKLNWVMKISKDANEFLKLYESDKKMAKAVVDHNNKFHWEEYTVDDYINQIKWWSGEDWSDEIDIDKKIESKLLAKEADLSYKQFIKEKAIDINSDFWKELIETYEDLIEWKKKTPETVAKYLKIALNEVKQIAKFAEDYQKTINSVAALAWWNRPSTSSESGRKPMTQSKAAIFDYVKRK